MVGYDKGILSEGYGLIPRMPFKDKRLKSGARLVYACLSSYSSGRTEEQSVWPSINTLCEECGFSKNTVLKHLKTLEELHYIKILKRTREDGGYSNNIYLLCTSPSSIDEQGLVQSLDYPSSIDEQGLVHSVNPNNNNKTIPYNNNNKTITVSKADQESALAERFEKLWKMYPNKKGKPVAFKAYKRAVKKGVTDEEIKAGIEAYKQQIKVQHTEKSFVAHGSTWFNQERWADEYDTINQNTGLGEYSRGLEDDLGW